MPAPLPSLDAFDSQALQGNISRIVPALGAMDPAALPPAERLRRECLMRRFADRVREPAATGDPLMDGLLEVYRDYWTDSLLGRGDKTSLENRLHEGIDRLRALHANGLPTRDLDIAARSLPPILEARGVYAITGVTLPYYELMAWTANDTRSYDIALPEGKVAVKVVLMDGFVSLGWSAWATCERAFSGGWATRAAIYAVRAAYDLESESYRVNLLAHEGQHFADYERFPKLEQPDLEYRAKLTEIALSEGSTQKLVARFASQAGPSRAVPHAWANGEVVKDLRRVLGQEPSSVEAPRLRAEALELLGASSAQLGAGR